MKGLRKILLTVLGMTLAYSSLMSQSSISGVVNHYTSVTKLEFRGENTVANAVRVTSTAGFSVGDTVMLHTTKGFRVEQEASDPVDEGNISSSGYLSYIGKYTFLIIDSIVSDIIVFNNNTGFNYTPAKRQYLDGEIGQLVRVPSYENAVVTGKIEAADWDGEKGGIVAMFVKEKLTLNAPIDVSGQGFRGADPAAEVYGTGLCYENDETGLGRFWYTAAAMDSAGLKGEGAANTEFAYLRGKARLINGGGGGNARYSGGGGGGNFAPGGRGGDESEVCGSPNQEDVNGFGGYGFDSDDYYVNDIKGQTDDDIYANRVFMGGGGGAGTQDPGFPASVGGDGGGIIIIIADTIQSTLVNPILARGDSVSTTVAGAGAGGGGGGAILLDVSQYQGDIKVDASGGAGGNTNGAVYTGPGGGGGGGIYWLRHASDSVTTVISDGRRGRYNNQGTKAAGKGDPPGLLSGLKVPLAGFLFNTLPRDTEVCSDETPPPIDATSPKGGDDDYDFEWYFKPDTAILWHLDAGNTDEDYVFSDPLTMTTQFKRVVSSGELSASDSITYHVLQRIEGNGVLAHDTVCFGLSALPFIQHPDSTQGSAEFGSDWNYRWIKSTDGGSSWSDAEGTINQEGYATPGLTETTVFSRIIKSGVCDDTSNQVTVTVLPAVGNNTIEQDTIICYGQVPDRLNGSVPTGGDSSDKRYKWEVADNLGGPYTEIVQTQHYQPLSLTETKHYRRIFYSGIQDACVDITDTLTIEVLPLIDNNELTTPEDTVCENDPLPGPGVTALQPTGGDGSYTYIWQVSNNLSAWGDSAAYSANDPFNLAVFPSKRYIRRLVMSGDDDVCQDISDTMVVNVIPSVTGNTMISTDVTICQDIEMATLTANPVAGGDGTYGTLWQTSTDGSTFEAAAGTNDLANSYEPGPLLATTWFVRHVWSADDARKVCPTWSDTIIATVKPRIAENYINFKDLTDSICYETDLVVLGSNETSSPALSGGDGAGTYNYSWETSPTPNDEDFVDASQATHNYSQTTVTDLLYLRRNVESGVCANTSDVLEVFIRQLPTGMLSLNDGQDIVVCESDVVPVELKVDLTGELDVTSYFIRVNYTSDEGSGSIDTDGVTTNPGIIEHHPVTDDSADYVYTLNAIVDNNGCVAPLASLSGTGTVRVYQTPESEIVSRSDVECGPVAALEAIADRGGAGHWIKKSGTPDAVFSALNNEITNVTITQLDNDSETMTYGWVLETPRCSDTAFVTITHYEDPDPPLFEQDYIKMYFAQEWLLEADEPTAGGGLWTVAEGSSGFVPESSTDPSVIATNLGLDEDNVFAWTVRNPNVVGGEVCGPYADTLTIRRMDVKQYNAFSPNEGDELNKYYVMKGLKEADDFIFKIFNSWGTPIKTVTMEQALNNERVTQGVAGLDDSVKDELMLWDGTAADNVTMVPDGAYYYQVKIFVGELTFNKKGYILLKTRE